MKMDSEKVKKHKPSLKSGSGRGYDFEDYVAAYLMVEMLLGRSPLSSSLGSLSKLERQASDWEPFGDILLTFEQEEGNGKSVGCSVKSNRPITANGCSKDIAVDAWEAINLPVFGEGDSELALFTAPLSLNAGDRFNQILLQARSVDSTRLNEKLSHQTLRKMYDSFNPPKGEVPLLPGDLLCKLNHREFDFEEQTSRSEADAIVLCRDLLEDKDSTNENAKELWEHLLVISKKMRVSGGSVTRGYLAEKLRKKFTLQDDPQDASSWAILRKHTQAWKDEIDSSLAGGLVLPRVNEYESIQKFAESGCGFHVVGDSGSGKSSLVKRWVDRLAEEGAEIIWVKAEQCTELFRQNSDLIGVVSRTRRDRAVFIIDGLEACSEKEEFQTIGNIINELSSKEESPWQFVITCQAYEWSRVYSFLTGVLTTHDVLVKEFLCDSLSGEDMSLVCDEMPAVAKLIKEPHLKNVVTSPKILDVIARGHLTEHSDIACESDLVEWWWNDQVRGGESLSVGEKVVRNLAVSMADELTTELSSDVVSDDAAASRLVEKHVLQINSDRRVSFKHELLADWSRAMHLRTLGDSVIQFMGQHAENPPWLRAIRLFSQHLLDRGKDLTRWRMVIASDENGSSEKQSGELIVIDSWLEGIISSSDVTYVLELLKEDLWNNNCALLHRLIDRMFYVATDPDPVIRYRALQLGEEATVAWVERHYRIPKWRLWKPVLEFILIHQDQVIEHLAVVVADIVEMLRRWSGDDEKYLKLWKPIARLAIFNAEEELKREVRGVGRWGRSRRSIGSKEDARSKIYTSALLVSAVDPDRVARLVLKAAGRIDWDKGDVDEDVDYGWRGIWEDRGSIIRSPTPPSSEVESWSIGPRRRTSNDFASAVMTDNGCLPLFQLRPHQTCEAILGFLLAWPKFKPDPDEVNSMIKSHGFGYNDWNRDSAFYMNGPFFVLLNTQFEAGIGLIIKLVNFATDRYSEWWPYETKVKEYHFNTFAGSADFAGNEQIYNWSRIDMNTSSFVSSGLMALEKWFEDKLENDEEVTAALETIFREGKSLAFVGMLINLGKRYPDLFTSSLSAFLFSREIYMLDMQSVMNESAASIGVGWNEPEWIAKARHEWNNLPNRKENLTDICCKLLLEGDGISTVLSQVSENWKRQSNELPDDHEDKLPLLRWASNFDLNTWKERELTNGTKVWEQERPDDIRDLKLEEDQLWKQNLFAIPHRCQELLAKRSNLSKDEVEQLWAFFVDFKKRASGQEALEIDDCSSMFRDHKHSLAGLCAVLLCLGGKWLDGNTELKDKVIREVCYLLEHRPYISSFTPEDFHIDGESFLARCAVRCLAENPSSRYWRMAVGGFVTAYRYLTVQILFEEAHFLRGNLGDTLRELEALAISFAGTRMEASKWPPYLPKRYKGIFKWWGALKGCFREKKEYYSHHNPNPKILAKWHKKWLSRFAKGKGLPTLQIGRGV